MAPQGPGITENQPTLKGKVLGVQSAFGHPSYLLNQTGKPIKSAPSSRTRSAAFSASITAAA
ncbi:hypothetical protein MIZ03_3290 [Rhodoferax lithotrophicus]|uniref:Uncharacterized protein n=1 Tax=Rhodoferax lithotrophicus TaxID=2798804 RepID=A0ABM7MPY4_9BURK|nr:hypothetical protein MIZ03_3290 [Rhodoferax sp. MIZ03]